MSSTTVRRSTRGKPATAEDEREESPLPAALDPSSLSGKDAPAPSKDVRQTGLDSARQSDTERQTLPECPDVQSLAGDIKGTKQLSQQFLNDPNASLSLPSGCLHTVTKIIFLMIMYFQTSNLWPSALCLCTQ